MAEVVGFDEQTRPIGQPLQCHAQPRVHQAAFGVLLRRTHRGIALCGLVIKQERQAQRHNVAHHLVEQIALLFAGVRTYRLQTLTGMRDRVGRLPAGTA